MTIRIHFPYQGRWAKMALDHIPNAPLSAYINAGPLQPYGLGGYVKWCRITVRNMPISLQMPLRDGDDVIFKTPGMP